MKKYHPSIAVVAVNFAIVGLLSGRLFADPKLVEQSGLTGGIVVALDFSDGKSIAALAVKGNFVVQGLMTTEANVEKARSEIKAAGLYGKVSCNLYNGRDLPYVDGLVNMVVCKGSCKVPTQELMRVIVPGGLLMVEEQGGWKKMVKSKPDGLDEWNQFLRGADNNGVSQDNVGPPQRLRWHDVPEYGRSKALSPSFANMVSANGIVFTVEDRATTEDVNAPVDYYLVARDAFNGIELWKRSMKRLNEWQTRSIKSISTQQQRCLAAVGDRVYCCLEFGGPITALESRTGAKLHAFEHTERTAEFAIEGNVLYAIAGMPFKIQKGRTVVDDVMLHAIDLKQGTKLWSKTIDTEYTGGTLAVKGNRLVYHSKDGLTCVNTVTGKTQWTELVEVDQPAKAAKVPKNNPRRNRKPATDYSVFTFNLHPTIVLTEEAVHCSIGPTMVTKNLADGKTLWTATGGLNYMKSPDLFVANGLVWSRDMKGRDATTGKVVRSLKQEMNGPMSHDRCYRNRVTHRYYLNSASGGTDFMKLDGSAESPNPWARSTCGLAVMPANGMVYSGPFICQCAIGTMATGVNGFYNGSGNTEKRFTVTIEPRLVKGPAFGDARGNAATADDWPSYRYSDMRSAVTSSTAAEKVAIKWNVNIGAHPTAPVVAGDSVYVADREGYTLYALNRDDGKTRWTFTADGRIDSPPTYHQGLILFGSRAGAVYCLRASDGQLAWKFNGMPERRLICDTGRLESAWPVNGSVMIYEGTAYFSAGRSSFLDGGIGVFALDPFSGAMKHGRIMQGPYEDDHRDFPVPAEQTFQLEGCKADVFSSAGGELFMRHQAFKPDLQPIKTDDVKTLHLMASSGFLKESPQHRTYWTVDRNLRYGGAMGKFGSGPAGDTIAYDGKLFYEVRGYAPGRNLEGRGRGMNPLELYSIYSGRYSGKVGKENRSAIPSFGDWETQWNTPTPFAGHAIAASANTLMAAGVPMLKGYSQEDTDASYAGKKGGIAWLLDSKDGHKLQEFRFDAAPVWDGIAIAHSNYFLCLKDGSVVCLAGR